MAPIELYGMDLSAPVRSVRLVLEALNLEYEYKVVDLKRGEHLTPEYLQVNPQHNVPVIKDDDFKMNESRAIAAYLVNMHGKDDSLYPKDPKVRARVDQRLYFDAGSFYKAYADVAYPRMFGDNLPTKPDLIKKLEEVLGWANDFVKPTGYVAGTKQMTIADLVFASSYSTMLACGSEGFTDYSKFTELNEWLERIKKEAPNYEKANAKGANEFGQWYADIVQRK